MGGNLPEFVLQFQVAKRANSSPFSKEFLEQWQDADKRMFLEASLHIDTTEELILKALREELPELLLTIADIVGTSLFNLWVKKEDRRQHLIDVKKMMGKETKDLTGKKIYLPDGRVVNITRPKDM